MSIATLIESGLPIYKMVLDFILDEPLLSAGIVFSIISYLVYKVIGLFK